MAGRLNDGDVADLVRDLLELGFSDYEAKAYVALFKIQPATAYEVSKLAGLPKANSYAVLESLCNKDAVQPISENPVRYVTVAPQVLFKRIADATERRCARLIERMPKIAHTQDQDFVWTLNGAEIISAKIEEIITSAKRHIWIKASEDTLEPYRAILQNAADRGVDILIILFGSKLENFQFGGRSRTFLHEGNGIYVGLAPHLITLTRDFEETLVAQLGAQPYGSYTRNKPIVAVADSLIRHEIYFAEIFEQLGAEIQGMFGPALLDLRRKYLPKDQVSALEHRLAEREGADETPMNATRRRPEGHHDA